MPDLDSFARTIAGTRAQTPQMQMPSGGGGGGGRGMIQQNMGHSKLGEAMGLIGAAIFGKKLEDREKAVQQGIKMGGEVIKKGGTFTKPQLKKFYTDVMKINKDSADILVQTISSKYPPDPTTGVMNIPSETTEQAKEQTLGTGEAQEDLEKKYAGPRTERAVNQAVKVKQAEFGLEKEQQPTRLEWAKEEEEFKQGIIGDREKRTAYLQDAIRQQQEKRELTTKIAEENRIRETPEGKLAFEAAQENLKNKKLDNKKLINDIQKQEVGELSQTQEEFRKNMVAIKTYIKDNLPTALDDKGNLNPVKEGSQEYAAINEIFQRFGHTADWKIVKDNRFRTDVVAPFVMSPVGAQIEANKIPKPEPVKLSPSQQKDYDLKTKEFKKKYPDEQPPTSEEYLKISGGSQTKTTKEEKKESFKEKYYKTMKTIDKTMMMPKINK